MSSKHLRYFENHETKNDLLFNLFCLSLGEKNLLQDAEGYYDFVELKAVSSIIN